MNKHLRDLVILLLGAIFGVLMWNVALDINPERRHAIFAIQRSLTLEMTYEDVKVVLAQHEAPFLRTFYQDTGIQVQTSLGAADYCKLILNFSEGRLASMSITGEDGIHDKFPDGPSDSP